MQKTSEVSIDLGSLKRFGRRAKRSFGDMRSQAELGTENLCGAGQFGMNQRVQAVAVAVDLLAAEAVESLGEHRHGDAQGLADLFGLERTLPRTESGSRRRVGQARVGAQAHHSGDTRDLW
jgi:hypothetical protein